MHRLTQILCLFLAIVETAAATSERTRPLEEVASARPFLRWPRAAYQNYAYQNYTNYANHTFPYIDTPKDQYDFLGSYLVTGYDLYEWKETRVPGQEFGSSIFKEFG